MSSDKSVNLEKTDSRELVRRIYDAPSPESFVRSLPSQAFYMAVQALGLEEARSLVELATREQYRAFLDFEIWEKDAINEENLWNWLQAVDSETSLEPLLKFVGAADRQLLALIVARYVDYLVMDEASEAPPEPLYYTPDHGFTWVRIALQDREKHRLLARLLAVIFQTSPELFYQLLFTSKAATCLELEEELYQRRTKRLFAEAIPDFASAAEVNKKVSAASLTSEQAAREADKEAPLLTSAVLPLVYEGGLYKLLRDFLRQVEQAGRLEQVEGELTLLANAGIVYYDVPFYDFGAVRFLLQKIKGALNIGLERLHGLQGGVFLEIYRLAGLRGIYQAGLFELDVLRRRAEKVCALALETAREADKLVLEKARQRFPELPVFLKVAEGGAGKLKPESTSFDSLDDIRLVLDYIEQRFPLS